MGVFKKIKKGAKKLGDHISKGVDKLDQHIDNGAIEKGLKKFGDHIEKGYKKFESYFQSKPTKTEINIYFNQLNEEINSLSDKDQEDLVTKRDLLEEMKAFRKWCDSFNDDTDASVPVVEVSSDGSTTTTTTTTTTPVDPVAENSDDSGEALLTTLTTSSKPHVYHVEFDDGSTTTTTASPVVENADSSGEAVITTVVPIVKVSSDGSTTTTNKDSLFELSQGGVFTMVSEDNSADESSDRFTPEYEDAVQVLGDLHIVVGE